MKVFNVSDFQVCHGCGMSLPTAAAYHPWAACELFKAKRNGNQVEVNLRAVVEYGMRAQAAGVSVDTAMRNLTTVPTWDELRIHP